MGHHGPSCTAHKGRDQSYSSWSHRPPREQTSGAYNMLTELDQVWLWVIQMLQRQKGFAWNSAEVVGCMTLFCLGAFFFRLRHVLCDPGCARTVARTEQGQPCSFAVRVCPGLRLRCAVGDPAQHKKVAIGDPSYTLQCMVSPTVHGFIALLGKRSLGHTKCPQSLTRCGG